MLPLELITNTHRYLDFLLRLNSLQMFQIQYYLHLHRNISNGANKCVL